VQQISQVSNLARETVYRNLPKLQEQGLVIKAITKPSIFKSIPIEEGFSILLKRKTKQVSELRNLKQIFLKNFIKSSLNNKQQIDSINIEFISRKKPLFLKTRKAIDNSKEILACLGSCIKISKAIFLFEEELRRAMNRGVKVQIVTKKTGIEKAIPNGLIKYYVGKEQLLEIRNVLKQLPAHVLLTDRKEVIINTNIETELGESPALWSNNPSIVNLVQDYFDIIWQKANKNQSDYIVM
jgi:sugar-specific transcriptional regulator TrmB